MLKIRLHRKTPQVPHTTLDIPPKTANMNLSKRPLESISGTHKTASAQKRAYPQGVHIRHRWKSINSTYPRCLSTLLVKLQNQGLDPAALEVDCKHMEREAASPTNPERAALESSRQMIQTVRETRRTGRKKCIHFFG